MWFGHGFVHGRPLKRPHLGYGRKRAAQNQLGERVGDLAVGFEVGRRLWSSLWASLRDRLR
jgi:hypothetical protein